MVPATVVGVVHRGQGDGQSYCAVSPDGLRRSGGVSATTFSLPTKDHPQVQ